MCLFLISKLPLWLSQLKRCLGKRIVSYTGIESCFNQAKIRGAKFRELIRLWNACPLRGFYLIFWLAVIWLIIGLIREKSGDKR